jgi:hypothetical protein
LPTAILAKEAKNPTAFTAGIGDGRKEKVRWDLRVLEAARKTNLLKKTQNLIVSESRQKTIPAINAPTD